MTKQWTEEDDRCLAQLVHKKLTPAQIAESMSRTVEDVSKRLWDRENPLPKVAPETEAEIEARHAGERAKMDPLQLVLLDFCQGYNGLGEQLAFFSEFISRSATLEQLLTETMNIESFRKSLVSDKSGPLVFLVQKLHERYIFVPRPVIQPRAQPSETPTGG